LDERDKALATLQAQIQALTADTKRNVEHNATKADVLAAKAEVLVVKSDMALLRKDMDSKVDLLRKDMEALGKDMTIKMGGMFIVAIGILLAGMRYLLA